MHRDEKGLLHLSSVVFGPWCQALGWDMQFLYERLPADVERSKMERIEEDGSWFLRFDCLLPARLGRKEAVRLEVASKSGTIGGDGIEERLLAKADGVIFAVDDTLPQEENTLAKLDVLERIRPPVIVFQFDHLPYEGSPVHKTPAELCAFLRVADRPFIETRSWDGRGVFDTFKLLLAEMLRSRGSPLFQKREPDFER